MRLYQSIYETALRNNIPKPVIEALIRIYSYDVDFQHKAQPGDSFDVLYAQDDENDVMFAALTTGGEVKRYYRFQTTDDGIVDYYDETGKSAKKFLVRKPVADRNHAVRLRRPQSSAARLLQDAHRRRLGRPARHRDLRLRQRHDREGRLGERLRQIRPHQALQRLRNRLRPHDRVLALDPARARASARAR